MRARAFPGIISAQNVFLGGPPHMRCQEWQRKGAQTRMGAKQWESVQTHACGGAPRNYFSAECFLGGAAAYAILEVGVEGGANARAGEVAEKRCKACTRSSLGMCNFNRFRHARHARHA